MAQRSDGHQRTGSNLVHFQNQHQARNQNTSINQQTRQHNSSVSNPRPILEPRPPSHRQQLQQQQLPTTTSTTSQAARPILRPRLSTSRSTTITPTSGASTPRQPVPGPASTSSSIHTTANRPPQSRNPPPTRPVVAGTSHYGGPEPVHYSHQDDVDENEVNDNREGDYATRQVRERANLVLDNYHLLVKYAVANGLSIPKTRVYFQKVAAGFHTEPVISKWYPF